MVVSSWLPSRWLEAVGAGEVDASDLASLFEVALEVESGDGLFETVVSAVAEEGAIHHPALRPVLGDAASARLAWFDARIIAFTSANSDHWDELQGPYDDALTFLREAMRGPTVAERLRQVDGGLRAGGGCCRPRGRRSADDPPHGCRQFPGVLHAGHFEAEEFEARFDRSLNGVEDAEAADLERRREDRVDRAMWVALDRFESDPTVRAAAVRESFADATGALKSGLTESETEALEAWATNHALEGGLLLDDVNGLAAGTAIVRSESGRSAP
jgi:hypothetical protein